MKILSLCLFLAQAIGAFGAAFTSTQSGNFSAGSTWVGGSAPSASGDTWTIASGHTVVYDTDNSAAAAGWGASVVTGSLTMTNAQCYFKVGGNLSGAGTWRIGSPANPILFNADNTPMVVVEFTGAAQCTMAGTNNLVWYGATNHVWNGFLSNTATVGATSLSLSNLPASIGTNDVFWMGRTNQGQIGEFYFVDSVSGNTINLKSVLTLTNTWPGSVFTNTSVTVANRSNGTPVSVLSCPIVVIEKSPRAISTITASQTNTIIGVRFQNLGKGLGTSCSGWTVNNCTVNNCSNGGLGSTSCYGWTVNNCTNINSGSLFKTSFDILMISTKSTNDSLFVPSFTYYSPICSDYQYFYGLAGNVFPTNNPLGFAHQILATNSPVALYLTFSVRPHGNRTVVVGCFQTNSVTYSATMMPATCKPPSTTNIVSAAASGGWTNVPMSWSNSNSYPQTVTIWVDAKAATLTTGYTTVTLGPDNVTAKQ